MLPIHKFRLALLSLLLAGFATASAGHLPTVYLTTADSTAITSKDVWREHTRLRIVLPDGTTAYQSDEAEVRARGHSTFSKPKKPFALKLDRRSPLLGMKPHKRWVLLANFMDHSLLRNSLALAVARHTSLEWTPNSRLVDVVVNGQPQGCYLLCEAIRVDDHRVRVARQGGFLVEIDSYPGEPYRFVTRRRQLPVNIAYPKEPTAGEMDSIAARLNRVEDLLYGGDTDWGRLYGEYLDRDAFADWWLVHELTQNAEPNGPRSCYMYRGEDGRLKAGPVWDFDLAFITVGLDRGGDLRPVRLNRPDAVRLTGDSLYNRHALWYDRLMQDPGFTRRVRERWQQMKPGLYALTDSIDRWRALIEPSARADEQMWKGQDPARFDPYTDWAASVDNLKAVYAYRLRSLDRLLQTLP